MLKYLLKIKRITTPQVDSSSLNQQFCKAILKESFYNYFRHLSSGNRTRDKNQLYFSNAELMKVALRFFMCDYIREKDTAVNYHICVWLNGIEENIQWPTLIKTLTTSILKMNNLNAKLTVRFYCCFHAQLVTSQETVAQHTRSNKSSQPQSSVQGCDATMPTHIQMPVTKNYYANFYYSNTANNCAFSILSAHLKWPRGQAI